MTTFDEALKNAIDEVTKACDRSKSDEAKVAPMNTFIFLLGAPSAARRMPGIDDHMGWTGHYQCPTKAKQDELAQNITKYYQIKDLQTLIQQGQRIFGTMDDYSIFKSIDDGKPLLDPETLQPHVRAAFNDYQQFCRRFFPYLGKEGFYGFDFNERVTLVRQCYAAGLIEFEDYEALLHDTCKAALTIFKDWKTFAISCLCGATYFMYKNNHSEQAALNYLNMNKNIFISLFQEQSLYSIIQFGNQPN